MNIGEIVEIMIRLRDDIQLDERTDKAVCAAEIAYYSGQIKELKNILEETDIRW